METISTPPPLGLAEGPEFLLLLTPSGQEGAWFCTEQTGEEELWVPRFSLGGTGGTDPPASDRDKLRLGLVLPTWLCLLLREADSELWSVDVRASSTLKQMESWESLLGGGTPGSAGGQKWTGVVLRRLKTVLGFGTGFTIVLLSEFVSMADRLGAELFLNASKLMGPADRWGDPPQPRSVTD